MMKYNEWMTCLFDPNVFDDMKCPIIKTKRGSGKTSFAIANAIDSAIRNPCRSIAIVVKDDLARIIFDKLSSSLDCFRIKENDRTVFLSNSSLIKVSSASMYLEDSGFQYAIFDDFDLFFNNNMSYDVLFMSMFKQIIKWNNQVTILTSEENKASDRLLNMAPEFFRKIEIK